MKQSYGGKQAESGKISLHANDSSIIVAGLLMSKRNKKNGIELAVDDYTGILSVTAVTEDAKKQASVLAMDQMVMMELENGKGAPGLRVKNIMTPDIPDHIPSRSKSEAYAVLISDLHVGSKCFMEKEFLQFLEWLSADSDLVHNIKFLCIAGDLIDGIGIFPNQDKELLEMDAGKQMNHVVQLLAKVPKHIKMFVIPGNHDPGRRALPQPAIPGKDPGHHLYGLENCIMLGNPAFVDLNGPAPAGGAVLSRPQLFKAGGSHESASQGAAPVSDLRRTDSGRPRARGYDGHFRRARYFPFGARACNGRAELPRNACREFRRLAESDKGPADYGHYADAGDGHYC